MREFPPSLIEGFRSRTDARAGKVVARVAGGRPGPDPYSKFVGRLDRVVSRLHQADPGPHSEIVDVGGLPDMRWVQSPEANAISDLLTLRSGLEAKLAFRIQSGDIAAGHVPGVFAGAVRRLTHESTVVDRTVARLGEYAQEIGGRNGEALRELAQHAATLNVAANDVVHREVGLAFLKHSDGLLPESGWIGDVVDPNRFEDMASSAGYQYLGLLDRALETDHLGIADAGPSTVRSPQVCPEVNLDKYGPIELSLTRLP